MLKSGVRVECEESDLGEVRVDGTDNKIKEFIILGWVGETTQWVKMLTE